MPCIQYVKKRFEPNTLDIIEKANEIIEDYAEQGLSLTLRQLYYRFVAAGAIPNDDREYSRLGDIISNGRLAGLIDWDAIEDRGRELRTSSHWEEPAGIIASAAESYRIDRWIDQKYRIECWVEKQALEGVIAQACRPLDVPYFACKGYTSQSEMWRASERFRKYLVENGQVPIILHLGDHDPSGVDMTRDIEERLNDLFRLSDIIGGGVRIPVVRLALNMTQIEKYDPPPNPAKLSDSRAREYIKKYGDSSWELDALEPATLRDLIQSHITALMQRGLYDAKVALEKQGRDQLAIASEKWREIEKSMGFVPVDCNSRVKKPSVPAWMSELDQRRRVRKEQESAAKAEKEKLSAKAKKVPAKAKPPAKKKPPVKTKKKGAKKKR